MSRGLGDVYKRQIAEAYYDIPSGIIDRALDYLPDDMLRVLDQYCSHVMKHLGKRGK